MFDMKKLYSLTIALLCAVAFCGCNDDDDNPFVGTDNYISGWNVILGEETHAASIAGNEITLTVPDGTDLSGAKHEVSICEHATIAPDPNEITSWNLEQTFTVTSYTGEKREYNFNIRYSAISASGSVILNTQAEVDAFADSNVTVIDGVVYIATEASNEPVKNLHALSKITGINGTLTIGEYYEGEDLKGLDHIQFLGGLDIQSDDEVLSSIEMENLRKVGNHINIAGKYEKVQFPYLETVYGNVLIGSANYSSYQTTSLNLNSLKYVGNTFEFRMQDDVTQVEFPSLEHVVEIRSSSANLELVSFPQLTNCQTIVFNKSKNMSLAIPQVSELPGKLDIITTDYATLLKGLKKIGLLVINNEISDLDLTGIEVETLQFAARLNSSLCSITNGTDSFHGNLITTAGFPKFGDIKHIYGDVSVCKKGVMTIEGIEEIDGTLKLQYGLPPQGGYCTGLIAPQLQKLGSIAFTVSDNGAFNTLKCPQLTTYGGDLKFILDDDFYSGQLFDLDIDISSLKKIDGSLEIKGYTDWSGSETDNVKNFAPFEALEYVKSVKITSLKKIESFGGLAKIASHLSDENNWEVTDNAFNPTLADMKAGKTEITDFN